MDAVCHGEEKSVLMEFDAAHGRHNQANTPLQPHSGGDAYQIVEHNDSLIDLTFDTVLRDSNNTVASLRDQTYLTKSSLRNLIIYHKLADYTIKLHSQTFGGKQKTHTKLKIFI